MAIAAQKKANGSFDFLDAMDIPYDLTPAEHQARMDQYGCTFLFARNYHAAVRHVGAARQQLAGRSIFNLIGPFLQSGIAQYSNYWSTFNSVGEAINGCWMLNLIMIRLQSLPAILAWMNVQQLAIQWYIFVGEIIIQSL